jgi:hypothetical protein
MILRVLVASTSLVCTNQSINMIAVKKLNLLLGFVISTCYLKSKAAYTDPL